MRGHIFEYDFFDMPRRGSFVGIGHFGGPGPFGKGRCGPPLRHGPHHGRFEESGDERGHGRDHHGRPHHVGRHCHGPPGPHYDGSQNESDNEGHRGGRHHHGPPGPHHHGHGPHRRSQDGPCGPSPCRGPCPPPPYRPEGPYDGPHHGPHHDGPHGGCGEGHRGPPPPNCHGSCPPPPHGREGPHHRPHHEGPHGGPRHHRPHHDEPHGRCGGPNGPPPPLCFGPYPPTHGSDEPGHHDPCRGCRPPPPFGHFGPGHHDKHPQGPPCHGGRHRSSPYSRPGRCCRSDNSDSEEDRPRRHGRPGRSPCRRRGPCNRGRSGDRCRGNSSERRGRNNKRSCEENEDTVLVQRIVVEAPRCRSV